MPARKLVNFDTVRKMALELPEVEQGTAYGSPALKVRGDLLACIAIHKSVEPGTLAVRVDFDQRAELIAAAPDVYYLTGHYRNYPAVLVRMSRIQPDALRGLLKTALRFVNSQRLARKHAARKPKPRLLS